MHSGTLACGYFGGKLCRRRLRLRYHRPSTSGSRPQKKKLEPAQKIKSESNLMERIHARVMRLSNE